MGDTSGNLAPLASGPSNGITLLLPPPFARMLGEARHGCPFPQEARAHGGPEPRRARGESQQRQSLQGTRSGSVWKVAFGDTSTHVAIFIGERGRVFLNGCNFWLFPSKRNFSFLFISPCLCFLHTSSVRTHTCTHGCARGPETHAHTHAQKGGPLVQQLLSHDSPWLTLASLA